MKIRHFLYNAFLVEDTGVKVAIDPGLNLWLFKLNSLIPKSEWTGVTHVLATHGDPDHFVYAAPMAKETGAIVICGEALVDDFHAAKVEKLNVGSVVNLKNIKIEGLNAQHGPLPVKLFSGLIHMTNEVAQGNKGGKKVFFGHFKIFESMSDMQVYSRGTIKLFFGLITLVKENVDFARGSIGFKITIGNKTVVNLGDTLLQKEWAGLKPDVLMIPIGGREVRNTMNESEARDAVRLIEPKMVIPCHYKCDFLWRKNINPADDEMFKREVENMGISCHIMHYGQEVEI